MSNGIVFFGLGEKAYKTLSACLPKYNKIIKLVIVARDSGVSNDFAENIFFLCKSFGVKCIERNDFNGFVGAYDYAIAIGWRWMISAPLEKLIVMHDSLLPRYRGFAPLVNCLINGERTIGVSALFGAEKYDCGNIIAQKSLRIDYPIKIQDAIEKISLTYVELAECIMSSISSGIGLSGVPQSEELATYSLWRDEEDFFINWGKKSGDILRFIDAVGEPYGGAKSYLNGDIIKIIEATSIQDMEIEDRQSNLGKVIFVIEGAPVVVCKEGLIKIISATTLNGDSILPIKKFRSRFH